MSEAPSARSDEVVAVIPARYQSTRFPGKLLQTLHGKSILQHVWERAQRIDGLSDIRVATDDERIRDVVVEFGGRVTMTSTAHRSGSDRIGEVIETLDPTPGFVLNLQGDEPLLPVEDVSRLVVAMKARSTAIWTLVHSIQDGAEFERPSVVKAVIAGDGRALYFSRSPIPYVRAGATSRPMRHVGIYGYPVDRLRQFLRLPPSALEEAEGLEQLRALENGIEIRVLEGGGLSPGVDVPEDLERLHQQYPTPESLPGF